jgi:hypothetical protein
MQQTARSSQPATHTTHDRQRAPRNRHCTTRMRFHGECAPAVLGSLTAAPATVALGRSHTALSIAAQRAASLPVLGCALRAARAVVARRCMLHVAICPSSVACCLLHVAICPLSVAFCLLHVARCMLSVACCPLHVARCMLSVACCLLHVAICPLSVACCMTSGALPRRVSRASSRQDGAKKLLEEIVRHKPIKGRHGLLSVAGRGCPTLRCAQCCCMAGTLRRWHWPPSSSPVAHAQPCSVRCMLRLVRRTP